MWFVAKVNRTVILSLVPKELLNAALGVRPAWIAAAATLICGGPFYVVYHDDLDRAFGRFEFQSDVLQGAE